jgi:hypothetical protein
MCGIDSAENRVALSTLLDATYADFVDVVLTEESSSDPYASCDSGAELLAHRDGG